MYKPRYTLHVLGKVSCCCTKKSCIISGISGSFPGFTEFPGVSRDFWDFPEISGGKFGVFFGVSGCNRL